jgi:aerobic carbon-monoxide dehydrogenase large subunit
VRREDPQLLRGASRFVADIRLPGLLDAAILRSPHAHARLVRCDCARALAGAGVVAILTGADTRESHWSIPSLQVFPSAPIPAHTYPPLAIDTVRFAGEPVACIVASDRYRAEDAAEHIDVEYDPLPAAHDVPSARAPRGPSVHAPWGTNVACSFTVEKGDVDRAYAAADAIVDAEIEIQRYTGIPMETRGVVATYDTRLEELVVWDSTQVPHFIQQVLARLLGLRKDQIRVIARDVGGGFGPKCAAYPEEVLVPYMAMRLGRPVRWIEDRREHFLATAHARQQVHSASIAVTRDGAVAGLQDRFSVDNGAYLPGGTIQPYHTCSHKMGPYKIPHYRAEASVVMTNKTPQHPYRGAGRSEAVFVLERLMDLGARAIGMDPIEFRLRNLIGADEMPYDTGILYADRRPMVFDSGDYPACFRKALEIAEFAGFREKQAALRRQGRFIGLGIAGYVEGTGVGPHEGARITVDPTGRVLVTAGIAAHGQGHETALAQVCADALGVDPDQITVLVGDTATVSFGLGTYASRSAVTAGNAVAGAAETIVTKAKAIAAAILEVSASDLELSRGRIQVVGVPARGLSLGEIAGRATPVLAAAAGVSPGLDAEHYFMPPTVTYANGVTVATVEVDVETGEVRLDRFVYVHDCGRVINPLIVDGQSVGGAAQGIGGALLEELVYDEQGQPLATTFMDYLLPVSTDIPHIDLGHVESPSPRNPLGVKGMGEGPAIAPPAAIANAVEDALSSFGVRLCRTPLTPPRVLEAITRYAGPPATARTVS